MQVSANCWIQLPSTHTENQPIIQTQTHKHKHTPIGMHTHTPIDYTLHTCTYKIHTPTHTPNDYHLQIHVSTITNKPTDNTKPHTHTHTSKHTHFPSHISTIEQSVMACPHPLSDLPTQAINEVIDYKVCASNQIITKPIMTLLTLSLWQRQTVLSPTERKKKKKLRQSIVFVRRIKGLNLEHWRVWHKIFTTDLFTCKWNTTDSLSILQQAAPIPFQTHQETNQ